MKKNLIFFLIAVLLCVFQGCIGARTECEVENPPWGCEDDEGALDSKCSIAHLTHTQQGALKAVRMAEQAQKACANRNDEVESKENRDSRDGFKKEGMNYDGDFCDLSLHDIAMHVAQDYLDMCGLIVRKNGAPFICDDPSNFTPREPVLRSNCPCPGGIEVTQNGCDIIFTCKIGGDGDASVSVMSPCPTVRGTDPQYPLVKMLSGTLVEWNEPALVRRNGAQVSWGASGGPGAPGDYFGASYYNGVVYDITVSSIDIGQGVQFNIGAANAKKNAKNPLDRRNIEYELFGNNPHVEILSQKDIYNAYKNRSKHVQAYTVLEGKGYRERPWSTYEKFIDGMCDMSSDKARCKRELAYNGHRDTEMQDNLYLGNGNMTIIGLYSDISSHGCHGATILNDNNEPAFGFKISSTWCFYVHVSWGDYSNWLITECNLIRECCVNIKVEWIKVPYEVKGEPYDCVDNNGNMECKQDSHTEYEEIPDFICTEWAEHYEINKDWVSQGGGQSTGDCGQCYTGEGYVDMKGNLSKDPYPVSFYQSQPLLINK